METRKQQPPEAALTPDTQAALEALKDALMAAGIVLPSLREEIGSPYLSLVELGAVHADVAVRLAEVVRKGAVR